jgi:putative membrane protein
MQTHPIHAAHEGQAHIVAPTFAQLWSPGILLMLVVLGIAYSLAVGAYRSRFEDSEPVSMKQKLYFWSGLALWYAAEGTPIAYYGHHYLFSIHMLQQSLLYLIMPPLLLLGIPGWLLQAVVRGPRMERFVQYLTNPIAALFLFNFIFSMYHVPVVMDYLMQQPLLLTSYKAVFLLSAFLMWFPVFTPLPQFDQMSDLKKMAYIFINGLLLTPACALIIFANEPMYAMYAAVPASMMLLSMVDDQQLGGVIMKIVQEIVYGFALGYIFFRWFRRERKQDEEEDMTSDALYHSPGNPNRV